MPDTKQLWIEAGDSPELRSGENSQLILRGVPKIRFLRGAAWHAPYANAGAIPVPDAVDTPVVCPVSMAAVAAWNKLGRRPEGACLVHVAVDPSVQVDGKLKLTACGKTQELDLEPGPDGLMTVDSLLFVYGDGAADVSSFDGVKAIDVAKGDATSFESTVEFQAGEEKRKLGLVDFLVKDPEDGKFRSARYGIFKTRTPAIKMVCPRVGANNLQVFLDDGNEETPDELDITKLLDPAGDVTDVDALPLAVKRDSDKVAGEWDLSAERSRLHTQPGEEGVDLGVLLLGENRIRIVDKFSGETVYLAHFLLYEEDEEPVSGTWYGLETVERNGMEAHVAADHLLLDFKDGAKAAEMAAALHGLHHVPQGFTPDARIVQASPLAHVSASALMALADTAAGAGLPGLESAGLDYVEGELPVEAFTLERYAEAFRRDFNAANGGFNNAAANFYHHFYIHTFPAHRLIDQVRFGNTAPPLATLEGSHFQLNKTFLLPSCKASISALLRTRNDHPGRKVALFGHADSSGTNVHNTALSGLRTEVTHALLVKDPDVWLPRLDGSPLVTETAWGDQEIQHMLKALGFYHGAIDGIYGSGTRRAARDFLAAAGLPDHPNGRLDRAARRRLISDYMDEITGPHPLAAADFHQDPSGNPALFACGEEHPLLPLDPANPQNRRVTMILRVNPPVPIDLTQRGAAAPYPAWIAPEPDAPAQGGDNPPFVLGCWDTGFGNTTLANPDDYSGELLDAPNRLFIRGRRLIRPTLIAAAGAANRRVFRDGDLSGRLTPGGVTVTMSDVGSEHGTSVMTTSTADGVGDDLGGAPRNANRIVLGTGKDVKFRPLRQNAFDFTSGNQRYRIMTSDPEVKVVTTSLDVRHFEFLTAAQQTTRTNLVRAMIRSGKIYFLAAANRQTSAAEVGRRDVARTEGGFFAPSRTVKRSSLTGANDFRRNIMAVGASTDTLGNAGTTEFPTSFTFLGEEVSIACPGENIRAISPSNSTPPGFPNVNGVFIRVINGTSFSTPMTAGIAAEMMLANPVLQQSANLPRVVEMLEATADPLPSLAAAPAANQGPYLPGSANADPQLAAADLAGFRRVHFWKAVLAALNDGLPSEQQIPNPAGGGNIAATSHFDQLPARDVASTVWYGFEMRSPVNGCGVFLKRSDGSFTRIEDIQAALPRGQRVAETWRRAQDYRAPAGHALAGFHLPAFPYTGAPPAGITFWFMCQFSAMRTDLERFAELLVFPPGVDPGAPGMARTPPMSAATLGDIGRMRNPGAITAGEASGNPALGRIKAHIEEFDDFVFHWTIRPGALAGFVLVHEEGANTGQEITVRLFAVDALGCVKGDFSGNVDVGHNGTAGSNAGGVPAGVFINGNPAGASTAIALTNGMATFQARDHTVENFRLNASDGTHSDDGASPAINVGPPGPSRGIRVETTHFDGRAVDAHPPRVGDRLKYTVTILDDQDRVKTDFTGKVRLKVTEGRMGSDGPPKAGVHVIDADTDPFDAARFEHDFAAADAGKFEFSVFHFSTGPARLQATHDPQSLSGESPRLDIKGGVPDHFDFSGPNTVRAGNALTLELRARDAFNNLINDFSGRVNLSVQPPAMAAGSGAGGNTGVFIGNTRTASDDHADFGDADRGAKSLQVTGYTAGNFRLRAASGGVSSDSPQITVNAPAAAAGFGFEVGTNQRRFVRFPVTVVALDAAGNRVPDFAGNVVVTRVSGPNINPVSANHTYVAADNGRHTFDFQPQGAGGALVLRARSGAVQSDITITVS